MGNIPETPSGAGTYPTSKDMSGLRVMAAEYLPAVPTDMSDSGVANFPQSVTYAAVAGTYHVLQSLHFSYNDDPAGGRVYVELGGVEVFSQYITRGGPGPLPLCPPIVSGVGQAMAVTLAAGGAGITGALVCRHFTMSAS